MAKKATWVWSVPALAVLLLAGPVLGASVLFTGSQGPLAAEVEFSASGSSLLVRLSNTGGDALVPDDVLTSVFFDLPGSPDLSRVAASVPAGSSLLWPEASSESSPAAVAARVAGNVGGEWSYETGLSGDAPGGAWAGISSTGLDVFGPGNRFPGPNLDGPPSPGDMSYGILSAGDDGLTGNKQVTGKRTFVSDSVLFELTGLPESFDVEGIDNVWFHYGTSWQQPTFSGDPDPTPPQAVPEPLTATAALLAIGGLARYARRRKTLA